jgi:hypothetical protein
MENEGTKQLLVEIVNLLAELSEEVAQLANPTAGTRYGRVPRTPGERAQNVLAKLNVVRAALKKVQ